jgi:outer membrane lipoprotein carrier protein
VFSRALRFSSLAAGVLAAGCGHDGGSAPKPPAEASASAVATKPPAPTESAAPSASAPPPATAALSSADLLPVHTTAPSASAVVPPKPARTAAVDAGAPDAGATAASTADAGAAAVSPAAQIAQQVDALFARKNTYSARFEQQFTPRVTGTPKDSTGTLFVERPRKLSFRYDPPSMNRIVSDGVTLRVYDAGNNQMIETPMQKTEYPGALAFLMGKGIASAFQLTVKPAQYAGAVLEGKPIVPDPSYETVLFFVNNALLAKGDPGAMERLLILDAQGNKNRFTFSNAAQPAAIDPAEFTFSPPPGTSVVKR